MIKLFGLMWVKDHEAEMAEISYVREDRDRLLTYSRELVEEMSSLRIKLDKQSAYISDLTRDRDALQERATGYGRKALETCRERDAARAELYTALDQLAAYKAARAKGNANLRQNKRGDGGSGFIGDGGSAAANVGAVQ